MNILRLAYRNFFRNTRRSIISSISVTIAIALIIFASSYLRGAVQNISDNIVRLVSGHIRITTHEYERRERLIPLSEAVDLTPEFYEALKDEEIQLVSPRIKFGVLLGEEELSVTALGYAIDAEKETQISGLDKRIIKGSYLDPLSNNTIIGNGLAERLGVEIGDTLTIITRTAYDSPTGINLIVTGIFSTGIGGMDRSIFYIPLNVGQRLLDLDGQATEIVIMMKDKSKAVAVANEIKSRIDYAIVPFQHYTLLRYLSVMDVVQSLFYIIILIVACSTIANTMIMIVYERTKEMGMLKAMGLSNRSIAGMLISEAAIIGLLGSVLGTIIGASLSYWLRYQGIDITIMSASLTADIPFGPIIYVSPTPLIVMTGFLFGLLATIIVAFLPIGRVARLEPAEALRTV